MSFTPNPHALARQPKQGRAIDRFENVLQASAELIAEAGLAGFSIPAVAQRLDYTRASIYKFFPTPFAILNELTRRHFAALEADLGRFRDHDPSLHWPDLIREVVAAAAAFHNARPVGMALALGGALSDEADRIYALTVSHIGRFAAELLQARGLTLRETSIDVTTLSVDLATTCFRQSLVINGRITDDYRDEAAAVAIDLLSRYLA